MAIVKFTFEQEDLEPVIVNDALKGDTLLEVAEDNGVHLNHNCGEVCACSTCHIYVEKGNDSLRDIIDREEDFIDRAINPTIDSRLGCQCEILDGEAVFEVVIPDQRGIIGHEH
jgi:2Fe-2S ferredoxin